MFYIFHIVFLLFYAFMYAVFRDGLRAAHKISQKAKFKGAKNFWWFEGVRESKKLGKSYYVNKLFTIFYLFAAAAVLALGLFDFAKVFVALLMVILGVALIPMNFYAWIHNNKKEYGRAFILLQKRNDGTNKYYSSIVEIGWSVFPLLIIFFEILFCM